MLRAGSVAMGAEPSSKEEVMATRRTRGASFLDCLLVTEDFFFLLDGIGLCDRLRIPSFGATLNPPWSSAASVPYPVRGFARRVFRALSLSLAKALKETNARF